MRKLILLLSALVSFLSVDARQINEQEAQMKAQQFFGKANQSYANRKAAPRKTPKLVLANNREELYIFNDNANGGYVVISGDDRLPDVLAYSYDGLYDDDNIPSNMKAWMDDYADQVAYLRTHPQANVKRRNVSERQNIGPLLTCGFGQGSPYNDKCPEVDGIRCPTGCVATAMAQIMFYYQWPKQTTAVNPGYTTLTNEISMPEQPITTIDWANIRTSYRESYSSEEADAISTLMLLCGAAVCMDYDISGSGALGSVGGALRVFFGYNDVLEGISRRNYNTSEWEEEIYDELKNGRPVYYCALREDFEGHAFVMDGYREGSEGGYFHVNWGWGGRYSYVLMTDIEGWNLDQHALVGIQPDYPGTTTRYAVLENGKMTLYYDKEKEHRLGNVISYQKSWAKYSNDITECVIDPSMVNLRQRSLSGYFAGLNQLKSIEGIENINTEKVKVMDKMFYGCSTLTSLDLSNFKTEKVTKMINMFSDCSSLTNLDLSSFNTEQVTYMSGMFSDCSSLTNLNLSSFNTANLTDMGGMFSHCCSLKSIDLSSFNTENVKNMFGVFYGCSNLKSIFVGSGWTTANVTNGTNMFFECSNKLVGSLGTRYDRDYTDYTYAHIDGGTDNPGYFRDKNLPDPTEPYAVLSDDNTVLTFYYDKLIESRGGIYVNDRHWLSSVGDILNVVFDESFASYSMLTSTSSWFNGCKKLRSITGIGNLKTDNVTDMREMFSRCSILTSLDLSSFNTGKVADMGFMFYDCTSLTSLDLSSFNTGKVADMREMFSRCSNLTNLDVSSFNTVNVTNMGSMFYGCNNLKSLDVSRFKTGNVTDMSSMFNACSSLTSLDLASFNTANVTNMKSMFYNCSSLTSLNLGSFVIGYLYDMSNMFSGCSSLLSLDLSNFKTEYVTNMAYMFYDCTSLTSLDLSGFNTENVTNMKQMFWFCENLKSIYVGNGWTTGNVTNGSGMFLYCSKLVGGLGTRYDYKHTDHTFAHLDGGASNPGYFRDKNLPDPPEPYTVLSDNNTVLTFYYDNQMEARGGTPQRSSHASEVINVVFDESFANYWWLTSTEYWFYEYKNLRSITGIENLKTDNVISMGSMFSGCKSLTSLDLSGFNTEKVTNMSSMFSGCSSLNSVFVGNEWTTDNVTDGKSMFFGCSKLVGGLGSRYDGYHSDYTYAHLDGGTNNPGYFSDINTKLFSLTYMIDGEEYKTLSLVYGTTIIPEDEPTKEGYTFGGWCELPEMMPADNVVVTGHFYLFGDVNTDEEVDVVDVVDIARFVVAMPSESFKKELADLNKDKTVNVADAVVLVNHITGDQNLVRAMTSSGLSYNYDQCQLQLLSAGQNTLSLCLDGDADFTAFQFDVNVPEGTDISAIRFNGMRKDGHQLLYNKVSENCYRVTALSLSNAVFKGNMGELLQFSINGKVTDDICIHDIHFVTQNGTDVAFDALYVNGNETGVANVNANENSDAIYDLQGRKLSKVQHGVNIVNGKKIVVK